MKKTTYVSDVSLRFRCRPRDFREAIRKAKYEARVRGEWVPAKYLDHDLAGQKSTRKDGDIWDGTPCDFLVCVNVAFRTAAEPFLAEQVRVRVAKKGPGVIGVMRVTHRPTMVESME